MSDLQRQVAEVLGYTVKPAITKGWYQLLLNDTPVEGALSKRPDGLLPYVPMFETDLNAAWELLNLLANEGAHDIEVKLLTAKSKPSCRVNDAKRDIRVFEMGDTPAQAICKAFLKMKGITE